MHRLALAFAFVFSLVPAFAAAAGKKKPEGPPKIVVVRAAHLFDGNGDAFAGDVAVVIEGDRVKSVGPAKSTPIPVGATVVELGDAWVLPGLIDCHTHLAGRADQYDEILNFKNSPFRAAFAAIQNAEITLRAGFTTVRDVGSPAFLAVDLRDEINAGKAVGPRIVASGPMISMTGGHGDLNNYAPQVSVWSFPAEKDFAIADGVDEVRKLVRLHLKYNVDVVKIAASGGVLSNGDQPGAPQFTVAELAAAADEAHAAGRKIAAHAHGTQAIKNALRAGIDSIEHGSLIDDEGIRLMKEKGAWLVADIYNDDYIVGKATEFGLPDEWLAKEKKVGQLQRENFAKAVKAGVKIAFGTDAGVYPHGDNAKQFFYMVKFGMTPAAAIRSATRDAADLIGRAGDVGTIAPGRYADIIAVPADPLKDVRVLEKVPFVMKGGVIVKDELTRRPHP